MNKLSFFSKKINGKVVGISMAKNEDHGITMAGWSNGAWSKDSGWIKK